MVRKTYIGLLLMLVFLSISHIASAQLTVQMEEEHGVYKVPCKVNGMKLKFIFDTGASRVSISRAIANMMLENGYLTKSDFVGEGQSIVADGNVIDHAKVILRTLEISGIIVEDVEAIVVYDQTAPLLLGQSAIQKLGKVSLHGNQLIIQPAPRFIGVHEMMNKDITIERLWDVYNAAYSNYETGNYELAAEQFKIVYGEQPRIRMDDSDLYYYADCLRIIGNNDEALDIYIQALLGGLDMSKSLTGWFYHGLQRCYYAKEDYQSSIRYGQMAYKYIRFPGEPYESVSCMLAHSYDKTGNIYKAQEVCIAAIESYLKLMDISPTDCWDKNYYDPYLGQLYLDLSAFPLEGDIHFSYKYLAVSAAWGNQEAAELCKKFGVPYTFKPYQYVY